MTPKIRDLASLLNYMKGRKTFDRVLEKVKIISVGGGRCSAELKIEDCHVNSMGSLHGGLSATLVDCISGYALMTKIAGSHVSVYLHVTFVTEAKRGDCVIVDASVSRIEKMLAFLEVQIRDKKTRELIMTGSHTRYMLCDDSK